ncbi:MAG: hypothetical protein WCI18_07290 [Pseudomonadota bacterium]
MASTNLAAHLASAGFILGLIWLWWRELQKVKVLTDLFRPRSALRVDFAADFLFRALEASGVPVEFHSFHREPKRIPLLACGTLIQKIPVGARVFMSQDTLEIFLSESHYSNELLKELEAASEPVSVALGCRIIYTKEKSSC